MSLRSRITKIALAAGVTGALLVGAPLAANAATLPVFHMPVKAVSTGHKFDVVSTVTASGQAYYKMGKYGVTNYKHYKITFVRLSDKKVLSTSVGDFYRANYIWYNLEDHSTGYTKSTIASATAEQNVFKKANSMTAAQLKAYAQTHIS